MNWQGILVAVIVGFAAVALYQHVRGLISDASPGAGAGSKPLCHGCSDCGEPEPRTIQTPPTPGALHTPVTR